MANRRAACKSEKNRIRFPMAIQRIEVNQRMLSDAKRESLIIVFEMYQYTGVIRVAATKSRYSDLLSFPKKKEVLNTNQSTERV